MKAAAILLALSLTYLVACAVMPAPKRPLDQWCQYRDTVGGYFALCGAPDGRSI